MFHLTIFTVIIICLCPVIPFKMNVFYLGLCYTLPRSFRKTAWYFSQKHDLYIDNIIYAVSIPDGEAE